MGSMYSLRSDEFVPVTFHHKYQPPIPNYPRVLYSSKGLSSFADRRHRAQTAFSNPCPSSFSYRPSNTIDLVLLSTYFLPQDHLEELAHLFGDPRGLVDDIDILPRRIVITADWAIQGVEPVARLLGPEVPGPDAQRAGGAAKEQATDGRRDEGAEGAPVALVQARLEQDELRAGEGVAVVGGAVEEDAQDAAQAADDDLEAAPPVELVAEAEAQDGDGRGGQEVGDEVDLQDGGGLEGDDDGGDDEEDDAEADQPDVELVAEEVVCGRGDHGALEGVEGGTG